MRRERGGRGGGSGKGLTGSACACTGSERGRPTRGDDSDFPRTHPQAFCNEHNAYPLVGRPFGLAFVWGNSYQDESGAVQCMIATDSANKVAEMLQQVHCPAHH